MNIELGKEIRALRLRDGRTQEDLADALGVTPQAVSRWEKDICYPDMGLLPALANYFGVSIDELFGYSGERTRRVEELAARIRETNRENNGVDVNIDQCLAMAREGLAEFPGNETLMLCLASVLYNAGYVRGGEYHRTDEDGYDVYDTERHRTYPEWREAIKLYEKLLTTLEEGDMRHQAVRELIQLYVNTGETEKAAELAARQPDRHTSREMLLLNSCDGRARVEAYGKTLLQWVGDCAALAVSCVVSGKNHLTPEECVGIVRRAIGFFDLVCPDGNMGEYHIDLAGLHLYLSEHLWRAGDQDGAFAALDEALRHAEAWKQYDGRDDLRYTAPGLRTVRINPEKWTGLRPAEGLPSLWPCWMVPSPDDVAAEMQADPRWADWRRRCGDDV